MSAFWDNLPSVGRSLNGSGPVGLQCLGGLTSFGGRLGLIGFALVSLCLLPLCPARPAMAASASTAPHTGLEGGMGRSFGPDVEQRTGKNIPQTSMPMDAYGNPVTGEIPEQAPRQRPRSGAYGGYGKEQKSTPRPLPDVPAKPKWGF